MEWLKHIYKNNICWSLVINGEQIRGTKITLIKGIAPDKQYEVKWNNGRKIEYCGCLESAIKTAEAGMLKETMQQKRTVTYKLVSG